MIFLRKQIISSAINFPFYYLLRIKENPKIHLKKKKKTIQRELVFKRDSVA